MTVEQEEGRPMIKWLRDPLILIVALAFVVLAGEIAARALAPVMRAGRLLSRSATRLNQR
jgi:hypothetical protein